MDADGHIGSGCALFEAASFYLPAGIHPEDYLKKQISLRTI